MVGVDIDGVLNRHREHFCDLLKEHTGKVVDPDSITGIPLHEYPVFNVTRADERTVFNDPGYWTEMPPLDGAYENLRRLGNGLKLKVRMFSHRPWPDLTLLTEEQRRAATHDWRKKASESIVDAFGNRSTMSTLKRLRLRLWGVTNPDLGNGLISWTTYPFRWAINRAGTSPIQEITDCWLRKYDLLHDSFLLEKGNENVADPQGHVRNRFYFARVKKLRFFVEDDWEKAAKLAYICDVVFLLNHPYNQPEPSLGRKEADLPNNVVAVDSWDEIYKEIRRFS